jgi:HSP20 family molecular chaperone IbpA
MFPWNIFPFNKDTKGTMQQMKPEDINQYVQDMMGKMFPANMGGMFPTNMGGMFNPQDMMKNIHPDVNFKQPSNTSLQSSVFETHDNVFVRIQINSEEWLNQMKLYHTSNHMIVEHIPESTDKHTIVLPAIVKKKGASARYKDGMLEIQVPKNMDLQFSEIDVKEIL